MTNASGSVFTVTDATTVEFKLHSSVSVAVENWHLMCGILFTYLICFHLMLFSLSPIW